MNEKELIQKAYEKGLMDVIEDTLRHQVYCSIPYLQRTYEISFPMAKAIVEELKRKGLIEEKQSSIKGYKTIVSNEVLHVILLDLNPEMVRAWEDEFDSKENVKIICDDLTGLLEDYNVDAIVAPGNAFGIMNGGFDLALVKYYGKGLEEEVKEYIDAHFQGEQPIGTSFCIDILGKETKLIYTPTMRMPSSIEGDDWLVYQCMRTSLLCAIENGARSLLVPAFGCGTGRIRPQVVAKRMKEGYEQIFGLKPLRSIKDL